MGIERRQNPRAELGWPTHILASNGLIDAEIKNVSVAGALIVCAKLPIPESDFRLLIKPAAKEFLLITAEKVWSDTFSQQNSLLHRMGVRFLELPDHGRQFLYDTVLHHLKSQGIG
jgi:hypothetical protein